MNARDKTYTGKVRDWGLPDWTVIKDKFGTCYYLNALADTVQGEHTIEKLPAGYKFNEQGEIVKVGQKRYWKEGEKLEVGMIVGGFHLESKVVLLPDRNGDLIISPLDMDCWIRRNLSNIKPADTRTDKQKAVDSLPMYATNSLLANDIIDAIISGEVYGVKWVGKD